MLRYVLLFASLAKSGNESPINTSLVKFTSGDSYTYASQEQVHIALAEENVQIERAAFTCHLHCSLKSCCNSREAVYQPFLILLRIGEPTILNREGSPITLHIPKISLILPMWTSVSNLYKNFPRGISLNCSYSPFCCQCHSLTMDIRPMLPLSLGRVQIY